MPIEFRCPSCNQQLRVPDSASGKNAKCPKCATIVTVPRATAVGGPPPPSAPPPGQAGFGFGQAPPAPPAQAPFNFGQSSPPPPKPQPQQPAFNFGQPATPPPPPPPTHQQPFNFGQPAAQPPPGGFNFGQPGAAGPASAFGVPPPPPQFGGPAPNPFADQSSPFGAAPAAGFGGGSVNPYASPAAVHDRTPYYSGNAQHAVVDAGPIMSWAMKVWQENLGILVGTTFITLVLTFGGQFAAQAAQTALAFGGNFSALMLATFVMAVLNFAWQVYLYIGMAKICLKLGRQQRADFGDLFSGGDKFLPVFGFFVLIGFVAFLAIMMLSFVAALLSAATGDPRSIPIIGLGMGLLMLGVLIPVFLIYWPTLWLLIDTRMPFGSTFNAASRVTDRNRLTGFVLILLMIGISVLMAVVSFSMIFLMPGFSAILFAGGIYFIAMLFVSPLTYMIWAVAYLMMSGQIPIRPQSQKFYR